MNEVAARPAITHLTRFILRCSLAGAIVLLPGLIAGAAESAAPAPAPTAPAAAPPAMQVTGFRDAHWGMTAAEVKAAIRKDFDIPADKVETTENPSERTTVLSATVPDLIAGAGTARVSYILGYTTKKLIQVTVIWGTPVDPRVKPAEIVVAANQLRELLMRSGYLPATIRTNVATRNGTVIVFEGQDADKHTTLVELANGTVPGRLRNGKREATPTVVLQLSYSLDAHNPDIFRLKKGAF